MQGSCEDGFLFRKNDNIGAAAAENDDNFLKDCFIDNGDLSSLLDCNDPKRVIVGRTGAGKSALIKQVSEECKNVIELLPSDLSLNYIANNSLISFFEESGLNLSLFYGLLWKHILVVELLKKKFNISSQDSQHDYMRRIRLKFEKKDRLKEMAIDYFEKFGNKFWLTTEERMRELTATVESKLSGSLMSEVSQMKLDADLARSFSLDQKKEVVERGQKAVSEIQIRELTNLIAILGEDIFDDPQERFYITIDALDEEWADDRIRFKLVKSLIDTVSSFQRVKNVKIIIALRQDLLDKVLHSSKEAGFQEEKYQSLYLKLNWSKKDLVKLVDKRIDAMVRRRYTKKKVSVTEVFNSNVDGAEAIDYLLQRTLYRPRDIILFVNDCIEHSQDANNITARVIKKAEEEYSYGRLKSLANEWLHIFPNLEPIASIFSGMKSSFHANIITEDFLSNRFVNIADQIDEEANDPLTLELLSLFGSRSVNVVRVRNYILRQLYLTGLIGIKLDPRSSIRWSIDTRISIEVGQIKPSSMILIHPMFYRALSIQDNK